MFNTIRYILSHPLNQGRPFAALSRYFRWQIGSRVLRHPAVVPFTDHARLIVETSMRGATGNIYCGLHEFKDMAFVLHFLRPGDVFVDVGANVGTYTVLASKVCGATSVAVEPVPSTFVRLLDNIAVNHIRDAVTAVQKGVGRENGVLRFTSGLDTMNYAVPSGSDYRGETVELPVVRLDDLVGGRTPTFIKMDVEGYEAEVLAGATATLANTGLQGVLMETYVASNRYHRNHTELHDTMLGYGFRAYTYHPLVRQLEAIPQPSDGNTLYLRDEGFASNRIATAKRVTIYGKQI